MNKRQYYLGLIFASVLGGAISLGGFQLLNDTKSTTIDNQTESMNTRFTNFIDSSDYVVPKGLNFVHAAEIATPTVVHIRSEIRRSESQGGSPWDDFFREFWGEEYQPRRPRPGEASGSGVIISADGYIVTNNHVVENAEKIEIVLADNHEYDAELIGTDPTTDIALLKIEATGLPYLEFGNSDKVKVGEWVIAVGNPFNLTSTVTAGIVSAKARSIDILRRRTNLSVESFIQTDAAVNPGNSGGALVNLNGELVGINTAIATPTGTFAGYSFAVPSALVIKVVSDLKEFGVVQRALLGVNIAEVTQDLAEDNGLDEIKGIYVVAVQPNSAAEDAGLKDGDIIISINDVKVENIAELQEQVARYRPGDKVNVVYVRDGDYYETKTTLKNSSKTTEVVKKEVVIEGATFKPVDSETMKKLELNYGIQIDELSSGKFKDAGMKEGFIVTKVGERPIRTISDFQNTLSYIRENGEGGVLIEGYYPDGEKAYYGLGLD